MGTWAYGIFDNDVAADINNQFRGYLKEGLSITKATEKIIEFYKNNEYDTITAYLALASIQMEYGKLQGDIKDIALEIIENEKGIDIWEANGEDGLKERKEVLYVLKMKLLKE